MGISDFFKSKKITHDDPTLGRLTFCKPASWEGDVMFLPTGHNVKLILSGDQSGPNVEHRTAFDALVDRYDQLKTEIEKDLFELYDNYRSDLDADNYPADFPDLSSPNQIWQSTALFSVGVNGLASFELTFCFDWHEDHTFAVQIIDWKSHRVAIG